MNKIAIIIPSFNRVEKTCKMVEKLVSNNPVVKIFVCDSDSTDGTPDALKSVNSVEVINVGNANWWTGAVNAGIKRAIELNFEYSLILNDDIEIPSDLIDQMLSASRKYPGYILSPKQHDSRGVFFGNIYVGLFKRKKRIQYGGSPTIVHTSNGCCLLVPNLVFNKIGIFHERSCPHLYGDTEFQIRAFNNLIKTLVIPEIVITQHENTDYFKKLTLSKLFTSPSSPVHFASYRRFGTTLFRGSFKFYLLGFSFHYTYIKNLIKATIVIKK